MDTVKEIILSDVQKIQLLQNSNKLRKKWNKLNREAKVQILSGMDIATDDRWILGLFEEIKL